MKLKFIEATNGRNWGKFAVGRFTVEEWEYRERIPQLPPRPIGLLRSQGWDGPHVLVLDLATGEGALFLPGGFAQADLEKHAIWVCPLFEPFLTWLYTQDLQDLEKLPGFVELPEAPFELYGHRRKGPDHGA